MKSRRGILEELDIKCRKRCRVAVQADDHRINLDGMAPVKVSLFIVAVASVSIPTCHGHEGQLTRYVINNNGLGSYSFEYETQDGTYRREDGGLVYAPDGLVVRGEYGYVDPRGRRFALRYIADANGFRPLLAEDTRFNDRRIY